MAVLTRDENQDSTPRLRVTAANTATRIVGTIATRLKVTTRRACSLAPARPDRRSAHRRTRRQATRTPRHKTIVRLTRPSAIRAGGGSSAGVRPFRARYRYAPDAR